MKLPLLALSLVAALAAPASAQDVTRIRLAHSLSTTEPALTSTTYYGPGASRSDATRSTRPR